MPLTLRPLRIDDETEALRAQDELAPDDFEFLLERDEPLTWPEYVARLQEVHRGVGLAPGRVPATLLVAEVDGDIVGRASIRHELNDFLLHEGGHIGYAVRPAFRGRGYAIEILRQSLIVARAEGVTDALVVCHDDNLASARTIEHCGGELDDIRVASDGRTIRRYWIR